MVRHQKLGPIIWDLSIDVGINESRLRGTHNLCKWIVWLASRTASGGMNGESSNGHSTVRCSGKTGSLSLLKKNALFRKSVLWNSFLRISFFDVNRGTRNSFPNFGTQFMYYTLMNISDKLRSSMKTREYLEQFDAPDAFMHCFERISFRGLWWYLACKTFA